MARRKRSAASALVRAFLPPTRRQARTVVRRAVRRTGTTAARRTGTTAARAARPTRAGARPAAAKLPARVGPRSGTGRTPGRAPGRTPGRAQPGAHGGTGTWHRARYLGPAGTRNYFVYVPRGLRRTTAVPLLVALHGCAQSAADFADSTRFNQLADTHRFVVAYPEQTLSGHAQRCWNWYRTAHQQHGRGEPAILAGIVERVLGHTDRWRIDPERVYLTGLSAGGAMAMVLAAVYPELFAAVGVHSAPPYRSAATAFDLPLAMAARSQPPIPLSAATALPPLIVFQGSRDQVVNPANSGRLADQWLAHNGLHASRRQPQQIVRSRIATSAPASPLSARSRRGHQVSRWYNGAGRKSLEVWMVDGLGHAWSGGSAGSSYSDPRGPRASTEMWRFFDSHGRATRPA